jgi:hypothetical protein
MGSMASVLLLSLHPLGLQSILGKGTTFASWANANDANVVMGSHQMQSQSTRTWRAENTLDYLQIVLKELDHSGDFTVPSIVNLRSIIAQRISSLEALQTTGIFDAVVKYESTQGVPL